MKIFYLILAGLLLGWVILYFDLGDETFFGFLYGMLIMYFYNMFFPDEEDY